EVAGRKILTAEKDGTWLALAATIPFSRLSCGFVGRSDGHADLSTNFQMDWEFDQALKGNVLLTGELNLDRRIFTLGLAFGHSFHETAMTLLQSLDTPFDEHRSRYIKQWEQPCNNILSLERVSRDGGALYHSSYSLILAHEDKTFSGAFVASLSIPWGESRGDEDRGGYHLVWTRDMVNTAMALLAAGNVAAPLRALTYLASCQHEDGGFSQNFWVNGEPYGPGIQLDEIAFPILLAWRLHEEKLLQGFDPYPMVLRAATYLMRHGPVTQQERWEDASGYSPSTLASNIAALVCAACFAREHEDLKNAKSLEEYADFLERHVESWTVTTKGTLVEGIQRHYVRINPASKNDPQNLDQAVLTLSNHPSHSRRQVPAKEIVDAGFLELVRYGIRKPNDPLILDSIRVVDAVLKVETHLGPCWHRYHHDGYGQRDDGGPFEGWGKGRLWPLLTGERGHYELAVGRDPSRFIHTMERFAACGLLPEQVWDQPDLPEANMYLGRPTGSAMPLMWAHAEYIKLLRSVLDGRPFDLIPAVFNRYCKPKDIA
ncbi:MAG: glycoside hydrolase family 15 protein, partial [Candidatus Bathyarchaeia archaeon]